MSHQAGTIGLLRLRLRSFTEAANVNGLSRILVGIHFRRAVEEGIEHGRNIGRPAVERFMRPVDN